MIERETRVAVTLFHRGGGGEFIRRRIDDVKIIALNPFLDLALLQIPEQPDFKFRPVYLSHDDDQKEGDEVFAIGNPLGLERSVSRGIVSTRNRSFQGLVYIQTTTQINPGNSGGPLFNSRGEVVGVTNMKAIFGEGIGFAIPVSYLKHFLANRDSFAFDKNNPNTGYRYLDPPRRRNLETAAQIGCATCARARATPFRGGSVPAAWPTQSSARHPAEQPLSCDECDRLLQLAVQTARFSVRIELDNRRFRETRAVAARYPGDSRAEFGKPQGSGSAAPFVFRPRRSDIPYSPYWIRP